MSLFIRATTGERTLAVGVVASSQTHGSRANWHPHLHLLVTDGGFRPADRIARPWIGYVGLGLLRWSYSWKAGLQARLNDGAAALDQLRALLTRSSLPNLFSLCGRALQVDGNLGATAAIAEMLLQSHQDAIHLLPALPAEWPEGSVQGLRARGGFDVGVTWSQGQATRATILAHQSRRCRVQVKHSVSVTADGKPVRVVRLGPETFEFTATAGQLYQLAIGSAR